MPNVNPIRILIADDDDLVRDLFMAFLKNDPSIQVVTVPSLDDAMQVVEETGSFDLVMLDYYMPGMNGLEGLRRMIAANDGLPVALMSGNAPIAVVEEAHRIGAVGFVPKSMPWRSIVAVVKFLAAREPVAPGSFVHKAHASPPSLSLREKEVLRAICDGKSNEEIADELQLQEITVKLHVKTLSRKLDSNNRIHTAMLACEMNLI